MSHLYARFCPKWKDLRYEERAQSSFIVGPMPDCDSEAVLIPTTTIIEQVFPVPVHLAGCFVDIAGIREGVASDRFDFDCWISRAPSRHDDFGRVLNSFFVLGELALSFLGLPLKHSFAWSYHSAPHRFVESTGLLSSRSFHLCLNLGITCVISCSPPPCSSSMRIESPLGHPALWRVLTLGRPSGYTHETLFDVCLP